MFKCFCCRSEMKHGGPTGPDLLLGFIPTANNMQFILQIMNSIPFMTLALLSAMLKRSTVVLSPVSKYSSGNLSPVEITMCGAIHVQFSRRLLVFAIISIGRHH